MMSLNSNILFIVSTLFSLKFLCDVITENYTQKLFNWSYSHVFIKHVTQYGSSMSHDNSPIWNHFGYVGSIQHKLYQLFLLYFFVFFQHTSHQFLFQISLNFLNERAKSCCFGFRRFWFC